jgi:hypothetical protein
MIGGRGRSRGLISAFISAAGRPPSGGLFVWQVDLVHSAFVERLKK